jgi:hypothetical protein
LMKYFSSSQCQVIWFFFFNIHFFYFRMGMNIHLLLYRFMILKSLFQWNPLHHCLLMIIKLFQLLLTLIDFH